MKRIFILCFLCIFSISLFGQAQGDRRAKMEERIKSMRIAYITEKLMLTPAESEKFWPLYNEFTNNMEALRKNEEFKPPRADMSEEEATDFINKAMELEETQLELKKEYMGKMKSAIPIQKIAMLHHIEKDFKKEMMNRVKRRTYNRSPKQKIKS